MGSTCWAAGRDCGGGGRSAPRLLVLPLLLLQADRPTRLRLTQIRVVSFTTVFRGRAGADDTQFRRRVLRASPAAGPGERSLRSARVQSPPQLLPQRGLP